MLTSAPGKATKPYKCYVRVGLCQPLAAKTVASYRAIDLHSIS